jgi:Thaumarchaeal output domain 1
MPNASLSARLRTVPAVTTLIARRAGADPTSLAGPIGWSEGAHYLDVHELIASGVTPDGVLLSPGDAHQAGAWLRSLRQDPRLALLPAFLGRPFGDGVDALSDGFATSAEAAAQQAAPIIARTAALGRRQTTEGEERLLAYLYVRSGLTLTPVANWHDERIYHYPLADALGRAGEDGFAMLDRMRRRGLLETAALVDRVHTCPACAAGQLLFVETCPQCSSIDTVAQNFLHCYACGNVGTQEEYLRQEGLSCPKCFARLRHIGVDYDRALETLTCRSCNGRFTEPNVKARCLQCRKLSDTSELAERHYYALRLSPAGELAARTGQLGDLFKLLDEFSQAHPEYFTRTLEWLLDLSRRHPEVQFGLAGLRFANLQLLASQLPRHRVVQLFDALAQRLRMLVRATDLFMREDDEFCWLLLPQTSESGISTLLGRISAASEAATSADGLRIEIATVSFSSTDAASDVTDARVLMGTLRNRLR